VPLSLTAQIGDDGQYLSADFDFHTQFSEIDSVTLQLTMPHGYSGGGVAGEFLSIFDQLWIVVHGSDSAPTFGNVLGGPPTPPAVSITDYVPAGVRDGDDERPCRSKAHFDKTVEKFGTDCNDLQWFGISTWTSVHSWPAIRHAGHGGACQHRTRGADEKCRRRASGAILTQLYGHWLLAP
jgi:hypothetical protein